MRSVAALLFALVSVSFAAEKPQYLATLQQRWDASDFVCIGLASAPVQTGVIRKIDSRDRDQLVVEVKIERCFKEQSSVPVLIKVLGYSALTSKDIRGGIAYSGPPIGFVRKGRNLLFLRRGEQTNEFEVVVPIYQTAIRLSNNRPYYPDDPSPESTRFALTQEFEAALVQFDATDVGDIGRIFDLLGPQEAMGELVGLSRRASLPVQRDIAVALLTHGGQDAEPLVISLLQDSTALVWKRQNAAHALGEHGTQRAIPYLRQIASQPANTDDLRSLRISAQSALHRLDCRSSQDSCTPAAN
jgi:hypothetical protein